MMAPTPDTVRVWCVRLDSGVDDPVLASWLSPDEVERASRFRSPADRRRFVGARAALRDVLGRALGLGPAQVRFAYGRHGKPRLAPEMAAHGLEFNVSHSEDVALVAVSRGRRVGVDLERHRAVPDRDRLVERFFHTWERRAFDRVPAEERDRAFLVCWTRKEAFLKAIGEGLTGGLDRFAVSFLPDQPPALLQIDTGPERVERWALEDLGVAPGFTATLAAEGRDWSLEVGPWDRKART